MAPFSAGLRAGGVKAVRVVELRYGELPEVGEADGARGVFALRGHRVAARYAGHFGAGGAFAGGDDGAM